MKKKILCMKTEANAIIARESQLQTKLHVFYNITVKPYTGKKYDSEKVCWVVVG